MLWQKVQNCGITSNFVSKMAISAKEGTQRAQRTRRCAELLWYTNECVFQEHEYAPIDTNAYVMGVGNHEKHEKHERGWEYLLLNLMIKLVNIFVCFVCFVVK